MPRRVLGGLGGLRGGFACPPAPVLTTVLRWSVSGRLLWGRASSSLGGSACSGIWSLSASLCLGSKTNELSKCQRRRRECCLRASAKSQPVRCGSSSFLLVGRRSCKSSRGLSSGLLLSMGNVFPNYSRLCPWRQYLSGCLRGRKKSCACAGKRCIAARSSDCIRSYP